MKTTLGNSAIVACCSFLFWQSALAITIDTVPIRNAGNAPDSETGFGGVGYDYRMGTTEVTVGQYTAFLNAVADIDDPWGLYHPNMATGPNYGVTPLITGIERSGSLGSYSYSVIGSPNKPVTYVNWGDAARFANWLHNGQPIGPVGPSTTEDGAYTLNGFLSESLNSVTRNAGATWFLPSENEWYKAAYHQNDGPTGNYHDYPTGSDSAPLAALPSGGTNSANFDNAVPTHFWDWGVTDVKSYPNSPGPYGTFDQAGNLIEWTEGILAPDLINQFMRGMRGGAWSTDLDSLRASAEIFALNSTVGGTDTGFRVATIPEPSALTLATLGFLAVVVSRIRRQRASHRAASV